MKLSYTRPTAFDAALVLGVVIAAIRWATAPSPSLLGLTAILSVVVLPMLVVAAWMAILISDKLTEKYKAMILTILRPRKDFLAAKRQGEARGVRGILYEAASAFLFFIVFLFYFLVMIVFFYGLGGQLLSDPSHLMVAAFLGTSMLHFSGSSEAGAPKIVFEFLVPFGIIAGLIDLTVIGLPTVLWLGSTYLPVLLLLFAAYYSLDSLVKRERKHFPAAGDSAQGRDKAETRGAGKAEGPPTLAFDWHESVLKALRSVMTAMIGAAFVFILWPLNTDLSEAPNQLLVITSAFLVATFSIMIVVYNLQWSHFAKKERTAKLIAARRTILAFWDELLYLVVAFAALALNALSAAGRVGWLPAICFSWIVATVFLVLVVLEILTSIRNISRGQYQADP
jgi:hypothetical protein